MKITKRQLRRIIREEKRRMLECGEDMDMDVQPDVGIESASKTGPVLESDSPEHDVLVEMVMASRALEQVVESVQNAAHLCPDCVDEVAVQAPVVEAMVSQAEALQEMLNAQVDVIQENAAHEHSAIIDQDSPERLSIDDQPMLDAVIDVIE
tara:strand:+ start:289 stop:744 length:456 start_codon:yes stop_codon:yes gene_type:complete